MSNLPFCLWPWFHQKINPNGTVVPCCMWKEEPHEMYSVSRSKNHNDYINSEEMNEVRELFKTQTPHHKCSTCVYEETTSNDSSSSMRLKSFKTAKLLGIDLENFDTNSHQLLSEEVSISNLCNLKCRMCSQHNSSKWIADEVAMGNKSIGLQQSNWVLTQQQVETLIRIKFHGGEPLLHQDIICRELNKIRDANRLHLLSVYITTNMTTDISNELANILLNTKKTIINCSIDAVGELNDYIRSDSNWNDVEKNIKSLLVLSKIKKPEFTFIFNINSVINVFNAQYFDKILDWGLQYTQFIYPILQIYPEFQNARNLPDNYKNEIIKHYTQCLSTIDYKSRLLNVKTYKPLKNFSYFVNEYNSIIEHLKNPPLIEFKSWKNALSYHNNFLDKRRHTNLKDVNITLFNIINEPDESINDR